MKFEKKFFIYFSTAFVILLACYFTLRVIAQNYITGKIKNLSLNGLSVEFRNIEVKGLNALKLNNLIITTTQKDTLFTTKELSIEISTWKLIKKEIDIKNIIIQNSCIKLHKDSTNCNYCFFLNNSTAQKNNPTDNTPSYSDKAYQIGTALFNLIPAQLKLDRFDIYYSYYEHKTHVSIKEVSIHNGNIKAQITTTSDSTSQNLIITGHLNKRERLISGNLFNQNTGKAFHIPFINAKYNAFINLTKIDFKLNFPELSKSHSVANLNLNLTNISASQPQLADTIIYIPKLQTDLNIDLTDNQININPISYIRINNFTIHPDVKLEKNKNWKINMRIDEKNINVTEFIHALPEGLFGPVKTIKTEGNIDYHFLIDLDLSNPDSLKLESEISKKNFRIVNPGVLSKMNHSFLHTAYEAGKPVRSFIAGAENDNFTPASDVSPLLTNAILQSEDGQFFYHNGFRLDAIREALIHDIKVKKFARGGSTISMQIVKNVFLDRNKNMARKLEEALIVWLIESNKITSKQRMFDVYLNIIEWGPNIYGVKEASMFYFNKLPSELTLDEAIFMASIIPRPKKFMWSLDPEGNLRESQFGHFRVVRNRLIHNGIIPNDSTLEYIPRINLKGKALNLINKSSILPDSTVNRIDSLETEYSILIN